MTAIASSQTQDVALLRSRLIESLYVEAMLLADDTRFYFEAITDPHGPTIDPVTRIGMSCESLKATTRLMHVIAWLLTQRAVQAGELTPTQAHAHDRLLGHALAADREVCRKLPDRARILIAGSEQLYDRALRLQARFTTPPQFGQGPARALINRLGALI